MRRAAGVSLIALGAILFAWVGVTLQWGDPITSLETKHEQGKLENELEQVEQQWVFTPPPATSKKAVRSTSSAGSATVVRGIPAARGARHAVVWTRAGVKGWAAQYRRTLRPAGPVGRIIVPQLGLRMVFVEGTSKAALKKGPGRYIIRQRYRTQLPGQGGVVAIAGHRTTYGKPFRYIDTLKKGDRVYLDMPYGKFTYRVYKHKIVSANNWAVLGRAGFEKLVLSACHPLHSLKQRWIVFARLIRVQPPGSGSA